MSSHREAPSISQDPAADNADVYAFVSPDDPDDGHDHLELRAAPGPARRPELLRVRRRRPLLDLHRQRRRRPAGDHVPVPLRHDVPEPGHVPLQHRPDQLADRPELEQAPALLGLGHPREEQGQEAGSQARRQGQGARQQARVPAVQRRAALDPDYDSLAAAAVHSLPGGISVFAGQRNDGFFVDLGAIFDLGDIAALNSLHLSRRRRRRASTR